MGSVTITEVPEETIKQEITPEEGLFVFLSSVCFLFPLLCLKFILCLLCLMEGI